MHWRSSPHRRSRRGDPPARRANWCRIDTVPSLRVALGQLDFTVGDLAANCATVLDAARRAVDAGAQLLALPEMAITGYPPEDLVFRASFAAASRRAIVELAGSLADAGLGALAVVVGYLDEHPAGSARQGDDRSH